MSSCTSSPRRSPRLGKQRQHAEGITSLPIEVIHRVIEELGDHDRSTLLATCKTMACAVLSSQKQPVLHIRSHGRTKGSAIRQILSWVPPLTLHLSVSTDRTPCKKSALDMVFGTPPTRQQLQEPKQQCYGVTRIVLQDMKLPALVPTAIITWCPNLTSLTLRNCEYAIPVQQHSSCSGKTVSLPAANSNDHTTAHNLHTLVLDDTLGSDFFPDEQDYKEAAEYLARTLPSMQHLDVMDPPLPLLLAWPNTLKSLSMAMPGAQSVKILNAISACKQLTKLETIPNYYAEVIWKRIPTASVKKLFTSLSNLTTLVLKQLTIQPAMMDAVLSLPHLTSLTVRSFAMPTASTARKYDWQHRSWPLQELRLTQHEWTPEQLQVFGLLPLKTVKSVALGCPCSCSCTITLEVGCSELKPNVVAGLQKAAANVARCGRLEIGGMLVICGDQHPTDIAAQQLEAVLPLLRFNKLGFACINANAALLEVVSRFCSEDIVKLQFQAWMCDYHSSELWQVVFRKFPALQRLHFVLTAAADVQTNDDSSEDEETQSMRDRMMNITSTVSHSWFEHADKRPVVLHFTPAPGTLPGIRKWLDDQVHRSVVGILFDNTSNPMQNSLSNEYFVAMVLHAHPCGCERCPRLVLGD